MKNRHLLSILSFLLVLALIFPAYTSADSEGGDVKEDWIRQKMNDMTLAEKIGQLFVVNVYGKTPTDPDYEQINLDNNRGGKNFKEVIENYHIGGVIYFNWTDNIGTPIDTEQVNALSNGLQEIAMDQDSEIPL